MGNTLVMDLKEKCPNCGSDLVYHRKIATGETMCRKCGWIWESDLDEAINQLIRGANHDPAVRTMLKRWQKSLSTLIPTTKEVDEAIDLLLDGGVTPSANPLLLSPPGRHGTAPPSDFENSR